MNVDERIDTDGAGANPLRSNRAPGAVGVALFMCQRADGSFGIEVTPEADESGAPAQLDPHDVCHALALYVQHNALELVPAAAVWLIAMAKANKLKREGGGGAPAAASPLPIILPQSKDFVVPEARPIAGLDGLPLHG